jgi:hypothetical protein
MSTKPHLWSIPVAAKPRLARRVVLLATLFLDITFICSGQSVVFSLGSGAGAAGQNATINLSFSDVGGAQPASLQWTMSYLAADVASVSVAASSGLSASGKTITCGSNGSTTTCMASGLNFGVMSPGNIAAVTVRLTSTVSHSSVPIQLSGAFAAAADGSTIPASGTGGSITISQSPAQLSTFVCSPATLGSGGSSVCTVTLTKAASSATTVSLTSSSSLLKVPASVSISSGSSSATFNASASTINTSITALITAAAGGITKSTSIALLPASSAQLSSLSCVPTKLAPNSSASCTVSLTGAAAAPFSVALSSGSAVVKVPASVSIATGSSKGVFTAAAGSFSTPQTALISASANSRSVNTTLTLAPITAVPVSIWTATTQPGTITATDSKAVELGMRFRSDVAGNVVGVRFYKGPQNIGTHAGHLWTASGALLGTATFSSETSSGWQQATFSKPLAIQPNTTYIISYYDPAGHYSSDQGFFSRSINTPPLHAPQDGSYGPNGVFRYGTSGFPNQSWHSSNYWVDLVFVPTGGTN